MGKSDKRPSAKSGNKATTCMPGCPWGPFSVSSATEAVDAAPDGSTDSTTNTNMDFTTMNSLINFNSLQVSLRKIQEHREKNFYRRINQNQPEELRSEALASRISSCEETRIQEKTDKHTTSPTQRSNAETKVGRSAEEDLTICSRIRNKQETAKPNHNIRMNENINPICSLRFHPVQHAFHRTHTRDTTRGGKK